MTEKIIKEKLLAENLSENTIKLYLFNLKKLNENKSDYKNLNFLLDPAKVKEKIKNFKPNTQRNIIIAVNKVLGLYKDEPKIKKIYDQYQTILNETNAALKVIEKSGVKSESQEKNWIGMDKIIEKNNELEKEIKEILKKHEDLTESMYNKVLGYLVLNLYTKIPPRRNKDFLNMTIIKSTDKFDKEEKKNYLILGKTYKFSIGDFKTVKSTGRQEINIPEDLKKIINIYLKFKRNINNNFLVHYNGSPLKNSNNITTILNKVLGGKVGSSLLRHIYLSDKYGDIAKEQKKDAEALGHSLEQQKDYIKV